MPTPFSHLAANIRLLDDKFIPADMRQALHQQRPAYLLGSVVADARIPDHDDSRAETHFYRYTEPIERHPWLLMLDHNPSLVAPDDPAQRMFVAGYVAHLAMDEVWTKHMLVPNFAESEWGESRRERFFMLHLMLVQMDERDLQKIPDGIAAELNRAEPGDWLPFFAT